MSHPEIVTLIIAYTCVGVFVATACITVLALAGFLQVETEAKNKLFSILIFEIVVIAIGVFSNFLTLSSKPLENKIDDLERTNQTFQAVPDQPPPTVPQTDLKPRVYFHIRDESQRAKAQQLAKQLTDKLEGRLSVNVPGVQRLDVGPPVTELRYFKNTEAQEAKQIADALSSLRLKVSSKYVLGFESSNKIRPRHYELWIASGSL